MIISKCNFNYISDEIGENIKKILRLQIHRMHLNAGEKCKVLCDESYIIHSKLIRVFSCVLKFHPYKLPIVQQLKPTDYDPEVKCDLFSLMRPTKIRDKQHHCVIVTTKY